MIGAAGLPIDPSSEQARDPYVCKIGGVPAWLGDEAPGPARGGLLCSACGAPLFLVAQLYAPVDGPRALHIFGCNRQVCASSSSTWRVFRSQISSTAPSLPPPPPAPSCPDADDDGGSWSLDVDETALDAQIEILLRARDVQPPVPPPPLAVATDGGAAGRATDPVRCAVNREGPPATPCFPSFHVDVFPQPTAADGREDDDDDDEEAGGESDAHIRAKLEDYLEREENAELRALLRDSSRATDCEAAAVPHGDGDVPDSYEQLPAPMRAMLRFQRAMQRCPRQVVRYAYGGEPLWSVADPPSCCPPACMCGAPRCFELQLMPGVLFMLRVDSFAPHGVDPDGGGDRKDTKVLGLGGMDWGVLTVWSCSESCDASCEEIAIVQPSEDVGWNLPSNKNSLEARVSNRDFP